MVSEKLIDQLFGGGESRSLAAFPLRAVFMMRSRRHEEPPVQLLLSVPKRRLRHAVDRNRAKRQLREAYRQNKQLLWPLIGADRQLAVALVWLADDTVDSSRVQRSLRSLLIRMGERLAGPGIKKHANE